MNFHFVDVAKMLRWFTVFCLIHISLSMHVEIVTSKYPTPVHYQNKTMKVRIPIVIGRRIQPEKVDKLVENQDFTYKRNNESIKARNVENVYRSHVLASINNINPANNQGVNYAFLTKEMIDENNDIHSIKRDLSSKESLHSVASKMAVDLLNTKRWLNLNPRKVKKKKGKRTELKNRKNSRRQSDYMDARNDMALMKHLKKLRKNKVRRDDREEELQYDFDEEELNYE